MWESGRNERHSSSSRKLNSLHDVVTLEVMLPWVSITPFI
jgi:hypothetical protein